MLKKLSKKPVDKTLTLIVMDGVGLGKQNAANAIYNARTPNLDTLMANYPTLSLKAHGTAVGLPSDDDMGNSEVGHNAIGAGQIYAQGAKLVSSSIESEKIFESDTWNTLLEGPVNEGKTLHFLGLFSDGNVHSHIDHLKSLVLRAKMDGATRVRVHILLDGRDVGETSALEYVDPFEEFLTELKDDNFDVKIASGGGRMNITMDRYEANWEMVKRGWDIHVLGEGRQFASAHEAIETYRQEGGYSDQDLPGFVIAENGTPVGTVNDGDSVVFFNFRGDRSIEISLAFEEENFDKFDRVRFPKTVYAGMLEYDGDLHIPSRYLVSPPEITDTLGEKLAEEKITQLALSETQKYGHVTYFWNGNKSGKYDEETETYIEIPSDVVPFEQRPWMKCAEITDTLIEAMESGKYGFIRVNFPNGDMVGHTGSMEATVVSMEALDLCIGRILETADKLGTMVLFTADHGNADECFETNKKTGEVTNKPKTSHTLNPVPFIFYDKNFKDSYTVKDGAFGLSNIAATVVNLLGYEASEKWDESMIEIK